MPDERIDLSRLIAEAGAEPDTGPDLEAIRQRAAARRSSSRALLGTMVVLVLALIFGLAGVNGRGEPTVAMRLGRRSPVEALGADPTPADHRLSLLGGNIDAGTVRAVMANDGFQYGIATARDGDEICILKASLSQPRIGVIGCENLSRLTKDGAIVMVTNGVPALGEPHVEISGVVVNGFDHVEFGERIIPIKDNMFLIEQAPYPDRVVITGIKGSRMLNIPEIPAPGEAPKTG